jgi:hypothetical protein
LQVDFERGLAAIELKEMVEVPLERRTDASWHFDERRPLLTTLFWSARDAPLAPISAVPHFRPLSAPLFSAFRPTKPPALNIMQWCTEDSSKDSYD